MSKQPTPPTNELQEIARTYAEAHRAVETGEEELSELILARDLCAMDLKKAMEEAGTFVVILGDKVVVEDRDLDAGTEYQVYDVPEEARSKP